MKDILEDKTDILSESVNNKFNNLSFEQLRGFCNFDLFTNKMANPQDAIDYFNAIMRKYCVVRGETYAPIKFKTSDSFDNYGVFRSINGDIEIEQFYFNAIFMNYDQFLRSFLDKLHKFSPTAKEDSVKTFITLSMGLNFMDLDEMDAKAIYPAFQKECFYKLFSTIIHELTHAEMYDLTRRCTEDPTIFVSLDKFTKLAIAIQLFAYDLREVENKFDTLSGDEQYRLMNLKLKKLAHYNASYSTNYEEIICERKFLEVQELFFGGTRDNYLDIFTLRIYYLTKERLNSSQYILNYCAADSLPTELSKNESVKAAQIKAVDFMRNFLAQFYNDQEIQLIKEFNDACYEILNNNFPQKYDSNFWARIVYQKNNINELLKLLSDLEPYDDTLSLTQNMIYGIFDKEMVKKSPYNSAIVKVVEAIVGDKKQISSTYVYKTALSLLMSKIEKMKAQLELEKVPKLKELTSELYGNKQEIIPKEKWPEIAKIAASSEYYDESLNISSMAYKIGKIYTIDKGYGEFLFNALTNKKETSYKLASNDNQLDYCLNYENYLVSKKESSISMMIALLAVVDTIKTSVEIGITKAKYKYVIKEHDYIKDYIMADVDYSIPQEMIDEYESYLDKNKSSIFLTQKLHNHVIVDYLRDLNVKNCNNNELSSN